MQPNVQVQEPYFPRAPLIGAGSLVCFAVLAVASARLLHWNATPLPAARAVTVLHLTFEDRSNGAIDALDADHDNALVYEIAPGTDNFVRGVLRSVGRERHLANIGWQAPLTMTRWSDGRLTLDDPQTGQHLNLEVFGMTNARAFAKFIDPKLAQPAPPQK